jgi:serine/threonine protein kinase
MENSKNKFLFIIAMEITKPPRFPKKRTLEKSTSPLPIRDGSIKFLSYDDFNIQYKRSTIKLGAGSFGVVNLTMDSKYAVKRFANIVDYEDFCREMNAYARFKHPCIMEPEALCIFNGVGYLAMPRATSIVKAFKKKLITLDELVSDLLSALDFLHRQGVIHGDIKPGNMVYHDGKLKLIDFGKSRKGILNVDGEWYFTGPSYTSWYKDPEYSDRQNNSIKCEIHSAAVSILEIIRGESDMFGSLFKFTGVNPFINWFMENAQKVVSERRPISFFMEKSNLPEGVESSICRSYTGTVVENKMETDYKYTSKDKGVMKILQAWLVTVAKKFNVSAQSLFYCLHLIHKVTPKYIQKMAIEKWWDSYQLLGCVCMHISLQLFGGEHIFVKDWADYSMQEDTFYSENFDAMYCNIFYLTECNLSITTCWDYALSGSDLSAMLSDLVIGKINPDVIRSTGDNKPKNINVAGFLSKEDYDIYNNISKVKKSPKYNIPFSPNSGNISPCSLNTLPNVELLKKCINLNNWKDEELDVPLTVIMHNRAALKDLSTKDGMALFANLVKRSYNHDSKKVIIHILQKCCDYNIIEHGTKILQKNSVNPFTLKEEDFLTVL